MSISFQFTVINAPEGYDVWQAYANLTDGQVIYNQPPGKKTFGQYGTFSCDHNVFNIYLAIYGGVTVYNPYGYWLDHTISWSGWEDGQIYELDWETRTVTRIAIDSVLSIELTSHNHLPISGTIKPLLQNNGELEQKEFSLSALGSQVIRFPATITQGLPQDDPVTLLINGVPTNLGLVS